MIILEENPNEQASIESKALEAEGSALPVPASPNAPPPPPPYFPQPPPNSGFLPVATQNHEPILSHPDSHPDPRRQSASRRFCMAFIYALLVIALLRVFILSVDYLSFHGRPGPPEWTDHKPHDSERMQFTKPDGPRCILPHCHPHPPPGPPPRRFVPNRYPPPSPVSPDSKMIEI